MIRSDENVGKQKAATYVKLFIFKLEVVFLVTIFFGFMITKLSIDPSIFQFPIALLSEFLNY